MVTQKRKEEITGVDSSNLSKSTPVFDIRTAQNNPPNILRKFKMKNGYVATRNIEEVNGITIHQTGVEYGVADYQVVAAGGDEDLALAMRSLNVACHMMAFRKGFIAWPNQLNWYVYHGNGFNSHELGLEIDGNYPGLIGGKTWNKKDPSKVTDELVHVARGAVKLLFTKGRQLGMPIKYIHAHRQSSGNRRSDPGEELWKKIVLEYAVPVLGLKTEPSKVIGKGRPIPVEWDPSGVGSY